MEVAGLPSPNHGLGMLRRSVLWLLVAAATVAAVVAPTAGAGAGAARLTGTETALLREMNRARSELGLAPLRVDVSLQRAARAHSSDMLRSGSFDHGDFARRLARFGVRASFAGENLAWGAGTQGIPGQLVRAWLQSPGHRANLLRPSFRRVGVGARVGSFAGYDGATVVTADFAG